LGSASRYGTSSPSPIPHLSIAIPALKPFLPSRLLFLITTAISAYYLVKFRKDGVMPYASSRPNPHAMGGDSSLESNPKDNTWSADTHDLADSDDETRTERGGNQEEDEYALLHSTDTDEGRHPGRPLSWGEGVNEPLPEYRYDNATALSPGGYEEYRRPAPAQQGPGYSFSGGDR
jgi:hypothetical protein